MEIVVEPIFQHVTWKIRDFFELPQKNDFYLDSPEFIFSGDSYCLRLYPKVKRTNEDRTEVYVRRLSVAFPERKCSCKVGKRKRGRNGDESYDIVSCALESHVFFRRSDTEKYRDEAVPDGIFTVVCKLWLSEESKTGSSAQGEEEGFPGHNASFSSRWNSPEMELSTESPCTQVELTVPKFSELPREVVDTLTSPAFRFAGDTYCLRFRPNRDTSDTDFQLERLTSTFPERTVCYRVGYRDNACDIYPHNSRSLVGIIGVCYSRSILEEEREEEKYVIDGTLKLVLFLRMEERSSARIFDAAQKWAGLPDVEKLQSNLRQLLKKETESDACFVVRGKEFRVHRAILRTRSAVFEAMFEHDTAEKQSGRVVVEDLDPDSFGDFLEYLYTGDVQAGLWDDNAFGLYVAADKYNLSSLKSRCVQHMCQNLTVDCLCDVVALALRHREEHLLQLSIEFFKKNLQRIFTSAKWQQFNNDNSASVNEFLSKAYSTEKQ